MAWIKRKADEHVCQKPVLSRESGASAGDIWECETESCGQWWRVHEDQREGLYWLVSTAKKNPLPPRPSPYDR